MKFDDAKRLTALRDYRVLDTPPEEVFDNITELATRVFRAPIALVSLVDEHRQWFKSRVGLGPQETPRDVAFCDVAIREEAPLVVADATKDARFERNPLVTGDPNIRFYCGVPLRTPEGHALGTLCIIDRVPRAMTAEEQSTLEALARQVEIELEIRRRLAMLESSLSAQREQQRAKEMLASMVVHDLRSPLSVLMTLGPLVRPGDRESHEALGDMLAAAEKMRGMLTDILDVCLSDVGELRPRRVTFSMSAMLKDLERRAKRIAEERGQSIVVDATVTPLLVNADPDLVERVLVNLIDNAAQHGPRQAVIEVGATAVGNARVRVEVKDHGPTIAEQSRESIFRAFERLRDANPDAPRGYGLGLAFCRLAVEAHGGSIAVTPASGGGNRFYFELPSATA